MARESFDKEIQFLRMLALTSGAYNRQQFADRLGISVHTFDKTMRKLKTIVHTLQDGLPEAQQDLPFAETLKYSYYGSSDPLLLFLFRAKSVKDSETHRLAILISSLQDGPMTAFELLDACCASLPSDLALPDEKTIRGDLKYLEEAGVIRKTSSTRPYRYGLHNGLVTELDPGELLDLYDFVSVMANTQVPSVQGFLLRDSLKKAMSSTGMELARLESYLYKYHYYSRILDEAHLFTLLQAIREKRTIRFLYYSPKSDKSYSSSNTNPLFERDTDGKAETVLPLKTIYDHQYGRWYLLGHRAGRGIVKFRMEGLTRIEELEPVAEESFAAKLRELEEKMRFAWLVDTGPPVKVVARFYNPERSKSNFVRERVLLQGQWGRIVAEEEDLDAFRFEITVNGTTEIKPWLRSFGSSCEVLAPARLRREFIEEWKEIAAYYEPTV